MTNFNVPDSPIEPGRQARVGLDESQLVASGFGAARVHRGMRPALHQLSLAARAEGFELHIASGYRSFERQCAIWNAKAQGARPVLDDAGYPLDPLALTAAERIHAILRWSALPGASRHHWGTDIDVYDGSRLAEGESVQLTQAETEGSGPFAAFHQWLSDYLAGDENPGFYRPYDRDRGGVAPEPWHLSFAPLANRYYRGMTVALLQETLESRDVALKRELLPLLPELVARYVQVPEGPEPAPQSTPDLPPTGAPQ